MAYCPAMKPVIVEGHDEAEATRKLVIAAQMYVERHPEIANSLRISEIGV